MESGNDDPSRRGIQTNGEDDAEGRSISCTADDIINLDIPAYKPCSDFFVFFRAARQPWLYFIVYYVLTETLLWGPYSQGSDLHYISRLEQLKKLKHT